MAVSFLLLPGLISARELFVAKTGNDANSGLTKNQAFLTIGKGLAEMADGDTLIWAEILGTALLRGDVAMPPLERVEGLRFVYAAAVDAKPVAVLEVDTLHNLSERFGKTAPEFEPGTWYYDVEEKRGHLSSSDLEVPQADRFRVSVTPVSGMILENRPCKRGGARGLLV